jgi:hypothetical protein
MNLSAQNKSDNPIQLFWKWFVEQSTFLSSLHASGHMDRLAALVNGQLDKINPELAWELGPGKKTRNSFTITGEGNRSLRLLAERIIDAAPELKDWELYATKQPRAAPSTIRLPERNLELSTSGWEFSPIERPTEGRIDLLVISSDLASIEREAALRAVSIYLDDLLGEDTVEEWLGRFEVVADPPNGKKKYALNEIADYLLWATHREKNPIVKRL